MASIIERWGLTTEKQVRFIEEYMIDFNATQAAIRAGYAKKSAYSQGQRLLKNVEIQKALAQAINERSERLGISGDMVIKELASIAFADLGIISKWGPSGITLTHSDDLPEAHRRAVRQVSENRTINDNGESVNTQVKLYDKVKALELLGKHFALWDDRIKSQESNNINISVIMPDNGRNDNNA